jgi:hypothetical protein
MFHPLRDEPLVDATPSQKVVRHLSPVLHTETRHCWIPTVLHGVGDELLEVPPWVPGASTVTLCGDEHILVELAAVVENLDLPGTIVQGRAWKIVP